MTPYAISLYKEMQFHNSDIVYQNAYRVAEDLHGSVELLNSFEKKDFHLKQAPENEIELERMAEGIMICWQEGVEAWI
jgi:hypothetical protein